MISIHNINVQLDKVIFENASFIASKNSLITITGKSGSGKTTLLKFIMQQLPDASGELKYNDIVIDRENADAFLFEKVSYIDQMGSYLENMTIWQHFSFYAKLHHIKIDKDQVHEYLNMVELKDILLNKYPTYLSTGQRKRLLIAIALMLHKEILIIDEPTASLDYDSRVAILRILKRATRDFNVTCICTTHDKDIVEIADSNYYIENHQLLSTSKIIDSVDSEKIDYKKIPRLGYLRYKNKKGLLLFLVVLVLGCIMVNLIPETIAKQVSAYDNNTKDINQNIGLILKKKVDAKYTDIESSFDSKLDFINEEDISEIKSIAGVEDVLPYYELMGGNMDTDTFKVYRNKECIDEISFTKVDEKNNIPYTHHTYITPYYETQNIKKSGEKIQGIYINEAFARLLNMNDFHDLYIETDINIPMGYVKNNDGEDMIYNDKGEIISSITNLPQLLPIEKQVTIKLKVEGVLPLSAFNDGYYEHDARIYMPAKQVEQLIDGYFDETLFTNTVGEVYRVTPRAMLILCQSGKEEEVKICIEEQNEIFSATNSQLAMLSTVHAINEANSRSRITSILFCLLIMITMLLVVFYSALQHKKEARILCLEGLRKQVFMYFTQDIIIMSGIWLVVSGIGLYIFYSGNVQSSMPLYNGNVSIICWVSSLCICIVLVFISNLFGIKRIVRL